MELAPRDVVARAVAHEGKGEAPGELRPVYLDMRHVQGLDLHKRFPGISAFLAKYGVDLHRDLIPVRPAAHYLMGGVRTDLHGRTSVRGLYAAGEAACTGVHGANRLASNSLLEGLVFGARAAKAMLADGLGSEPAGQLAASSLASPAENPAVEELITSLQNLMSHYASLVRDGAMLREGLAEHARLSSDLEQHASAARLTRRLAEARALHRVAQSILRSALARTESRGAHFRSDFPRRDDANFCRHSILGRGNEVVFENW